MTQLAAQISLSEIDVERALLGTFFENVSAFEQIGADINPAWFNDPLARYMFEECLKISQAGHTLNPAVVISMLPEDVGGTPRSAFYANVRLSGLPVSQVSGLVATLKDRWARRELILAADMLKSSATMFGIDPYKVASEVVGELDSVTSVNAGATAKRVTVGEAAQSARAAVEERIKHGVVSGVTWGLADLDRVTKLYPGELTILAARPSMGKTTVGLHTALSAAKAGEGVLLVSLEMGDVAIGQRALSDLCFDGQRDAIPYAKIRDGEISDDDLDRLRIAADRLEQLPLLVEQEAGLTALQIAARARKARVEFSRTGSNLGLLIVDHLGLIAAADRYAGARHLELGAITSSLKALAKDMGIPVLLLCQLSRGVEGRDNKRPMLSDLRESGRIEEDADCVVLLYREAYYLERAREADPEKDRVRVERLIDAQSVIEINVAKQRQGATNTIEAFVSMPSNAVRNAARSGY